MGIFDTLGAAFSGTPGTGQSQAHTASRYDTGTSQAKGGGTETPLPFFFQRTSGGLPRPGAAGGGTLPPGRSADSRLGTSDVNASVAVAAAPQGPYVAGAWAPGVGSLDPLPPGAPTVDGRVGTQDEGIFDKLAKLLPSSVSINGSSIGFGDPAAPNRSDFGGAGGEGGSLLDFSGKSWTPWLLVGGAVALVLLVSRR